MKIYADFHIHSKYSRATSLDMNIPTIAKYGKFKGLKVIGTGDFTHPLWLNEIKTYLKEGEEGLYRYEDINFILTTEVSNIFTKGGKIRKVHNIIFAKDIKTVEKINSRLSKYGNLLSDGRPILSLSCSDLLKIVLDISEDCLIIPAHAWTPHFSIFGANSGFDSIEECFEEESENIFSIETGLSSNPAMNWRLSSLDKITLVSNSDAHSPAKIAREANFFNCDLNYDDITNAIKEKNKNKFLYTIEFYPEEGKYHYDGHRNCNICFHPKETIKHNYICPVCNKKLTIGVLHRVEELADRDEGVVPENTIGYKSIIPLEEIISSSLGLSSVSPRVKEEYWRLVNYFGSEFEILLNVKFDELIKITSPQISEAIMKSRNSEIEIEPGYDGVYGKVKIASIKKEKEDKKELKEPTQLELF